ncbi:MAG: response regulator [Desulfuromonadaceae bacterium]|nr:response regulator [Desulfuromonadaceae bacterium]
MTEQPTFNNVSHTIFVVDDDLFSQQLLGDTLARNGYATRHFSDGTTALQAAREEPPDLVLLDVMMPDLDGFEVCRLLKESEATRHIPVVLVTCLNEKVMKLQGMAAGADDFISKPFDATEILLRTRNLLRMKEYGDILKDHNERLELQVRERTSELETAYNELKSIHDRLLQQDKMATIGLLMAGIAHEINNPVGFITSNLGSLKKYGERLAEFIFEQDKAITADGQVVRIMENVFALRNTLKIDHILEDFPQLLAESADGADRIRKIVQDLKCFSRTDGAEQASADINQCMESAIGIAHNELKYKATIMREFGDLSHTLCYPQQLGQVFINLLVNAAHAIDTRGEITVSTRQDNGWIFIAISDTGCGIPEDIRLRIFEPFFTTKEAGKGTGLGLSICQDIILKHGGEIEVVSEIGAGTTFTVKIPVVEP